MSRAVDPEIVASLGGDNLQTIYEDVATALCTYSEGLLDVELLGKGHPLPPSCNVLVDGASVGIPKARLVQSFVVARRILFKHVRDCPEDKESDLRKATAVILLMDPEHLTAANTRKRLLQRLQKKSKLDFEKALTNELLFVDSYLTSRLHRHTKSPTLWGHRRWLYEMGKPIGMHFDLMQDLRTVVLIAAERHPKNYYAWTHLRWLIQYHRNSITSAEKTSVHIQSKIVSPVEDWCLRHPSDISGFSFLLFLLLPTASTDGGTEACSSIFTNVLRLTVSFLWSHESVWVFLRTLVASEVLLDEHKADFLQAIELVQKAHPEAQSILIAARDWCVRYQEEAKSS